MTASHPYHIHQHRSNPPPSPPPSPPPIHTHLKGALTHHHIQLLPIISKSSKLGHSTHAKPTCFSIPSGPKSTLETKRTPLWTVPDPFLRRTHFWPGP